MTRKLAWQVAIEVLRETGNPSVMWGDASLLHMIANRANLRCQKRSWITEGRVLNTLTRRPGDLVPAYVALPTGRRVRCFWLPEHAPKWAKKDTSR